MKRRIQALCMVLVCIALFCGCGQKPKYVLTTGFDDKELCKIEGDSCYKYEALVYVANITNEYVNLYGESFINDNDKSQVIKARIKNIALARLIKVKIMNVMADSYKISLEEGEVQLVNKMAEEYYGGLSKDEIAALGGISKKQIVDMYKEYFIAAKLYQNIVKDVNLEISDDEARTVVVKRIYIATVSSTSEDGTTPSSLGEEEKEGAYQRGQEAYQKISAGESFDAVAMAYSDVGDETISYKKGDLDEVLEKSVFNLSEGETSGLITGNDGYYIFYCVNPFSREDTKANKERIIEERQKETFDQVFNSFAKDSDYYLNDKAFDAISVDNVFGKVSSYNFFKVFEQYNIAD